MTHAQRLSKLQAYQKTGMDGKKTYLNLNDRETEMSTITQAASSSANQLPLSAAECGITTIPIAILDAMFDKAKKLLNSPANVIPKPGATDGSFIVHSNNIHIVTPGKGGSLKCDRSCINSSTKICEHILAVAIVCGTFNEFLLWYKRSKQGPRMLEMTLGGAPKSAGKKPSKRKKSNFEKPAVTEQRDLLAENEVDPPIPQSIAAIHTINTSEILQQTDRCNGHLPVPARHVDSLNPGPYIRPNSNLPASANIGQTQSGSSFRQEHKFLPGTRVSKCYGCEKEITNPPQAVPDDLVVVYHDIRQYRDPNDGLVTYTNQPENVHFHFASGRNIQVSLGVTSWFNNSFHHFSSWNTCKGSLGSSAGYFKATEHL
jgi:hypothetical protein